MNEQRFKDIIKDDKECTIVYSRRDNVIAGYYPEGELRQIKEAIKLVSDTFDVSKLTMYSISNPQGLSIKFID